MRRGIGVALVVAAAACGAFGSTKETSPVAAAYVEGATVDCSDVDGGVCSVPDFCCVRNGRDDFCTTKGCSATDSAEVHCVDDSSCSPGYVCCIRVENFHVASIVCDTSCSSASPPAAGRGTFHVCGSRGAIACDGGPCGSLEGDTIGGRVTPSVALEVCQ